MQPPTPLVLLALFLSLLAAGIDAKTGRIPNWLTLPALAIAPLAHGVITFTGTGNIHAALFDFSLSVAGALVCTIVPVLLTLKGAIGGGDLKLFAAIGALCMPFRGIEMQLYAFVVGAVYAPVQMLLQGKLKKTAAQSVQVLSSMVNKKTEPVPEESLTWFRLGPSIFIGSLIATFDIWL